MRNDVWLGMLTGVGLVLGAAWLAKRGEHVPRGPDAMAEAITVPAPVVPREVEGLRARAVGVSLASRSSVSSGVSPPTASKGAGRREPRPPSARAAAPRRRHRPAAQRAHGRNRLAGDPMGGALEPPPPALADLVRSAGPAPLREDGSWDPAYAAARPSIPDAEETVVLLVRALGLEPGQAQVVARVIERRLLAFGEASDPALGGSGVLAARVPLPFEPSLLAALRPVLSPVQHHRFERDLMAWLQRRLEAIAVRRMGPPAPAP